MLIATGFYFLIHFKCDCVVLIVRFLVKFSVCICVYLFCICSTEAKAQFQQASLSLSKNIQLSPSIGNSSIQSPLRLKPAPKLDGVNGFKYEAFFCRMEQKSINKLGFCIQIHAGDYNTYYRDKRYLDK